MKNNKIDECALLDEKRETFRAEIVRRKSEGQIFGKKNAQPNAAGLPRSILFALLIGVVVFSGILFYRSANEARFNLEDGLFTTPISKNESLRLELLELEMGREQQQSRMISASQKLSSISNKNSYDQMARSGSLGVNESLILAKKMFDDPAYESKNATLERGARSNYESAVAMMEETDSRISELKNKLRTLDKIN